VSSQGGQCLVASCPWHEL